MFAEYTLKNAHGMEITISELGAAWISCRLPIEGEKREILLAGKSIEKTLREGGSYAGAIVGRYAGRIERAKYGKFHLTANQPPHCLHGGKDGFSQRVWQLEHKEQQIICRLNALSGEEGFPGNMSIEVIYQLNAQNQVIINFQATCDQDSACNLTNHAYFNLNGGDGNNGLAQKLQIFAQTFQPVSEDGIPTGKLLPVTGTSFDFRQEKRINDHFLTDHWQEQVGGYDHSFILLEKETKTCTPAAVLTSEDGKIKMTVSTTQPAIHLYTGQFLAGMENRLGGHYENCAGIALETQAPPNSPNLYPEWGILKAGELYQHQTIFAFQS